MKWIYISWKKWTALSIKSISYKNSYLREHFLINSQSIVKLLVKAITANNKVLYVRQKTLKCQSHPILVFLPHFLPLSLYSFSLSIQIMLKFMSHFCQPICLLSFTSPPTWRKKNSLESHHLYVYGCASFYTDLNKYI